MPLVRALASSCQLRERQGPSLREVRRVPRETAQGDQTVVSPSGVGYPKTLAYTKVAVLAGTAVPVTPL